MPVGARTLRIAGFLLAGGLGVLLLRSEASRVDRLHGDLEARLEDLEAAAARMSSVTQFETEEKPHLEERTRRVEERLPSDLDPGAWRTTLAAWAAAEGVTLERCWAAEPEAWRPPVEIESETGGVAPTASAAPESVDLLAVPFECVGTGSYESCLRFVARILSTTAVVVPSAMRFGRALSNDPSRTAGSAIPPEAAAFLPAVSPQAARIPGAHAFSLRGRLVGRSTDEEEGEGG